MPSRSITAITSLALLTLTACGAYQPTMLVIGDSISIGYTPYLSDAYEVRHNELDEDANANDTIWGITHLDAWLREPSYDCIIVNFGLHDMHNSDSLSGAPTPINEYIANLHSIIDTLKQRTNRLYWVTTTYAPKYSNALQESYNQAALMVMRNESVSLIDLHAISLQHKPIDGVHYDSQAYEAFANFIMENL